MASQTFQGVVHVPSAAAFEADYELLDKVGSGSTCEVIAVQSRATGSKYGCKVMDKMDSKETRLRLDEVMLQGELSHPNVVQLHRVYETPSKYYVLMELAPGKSLIDSICGDFPGGVPESLAARLVADVCDALEYLHSRGVVHRDVKPDNVLLFNSSHSSGGKVDDDILCSAKLCDFGYAARSPAHQLLRDRVGTPQYVAPEILMDIGHGAAADMWSLGVLMYVTVSGRMPFYGDTTKKMYERICAGKFAYSSRYFSGVSDAAKDLISKLLTIDPRLRPTAAQVLQHPWFNICGRQRQRTTSKKLQQRMSVDRQRLCSLGEREKERGVATKPMVERLSVKRMSVGAVEAVEVSAKAVERLSHTDCFVPSQSNDDFHPFDHKKKPLDTRKTPDARNLQAMADSSDGENDTQRHHGGSRSNYYGHGDSSELVTPAVVGDADGGNCDQRKSWEVDEIYAS